MLATVVGLSGTAIELPQGTQAQDAGSGGRNGRCAMTALCISKQTQAKVVMMRRARRAVARRGAVPRASTGRVVVCVTRSVTVPRIWAVAAGRPQRCNGSERPERPVVEETPQMELIYYRRYTEALLRKYLRMSTEAGRVSSLMGRELFRGNVTRCKVKSFEDVVIFCHDVERRLAQLTPLDQQLVKRIGLQQYTLEDTAGMLGLTVRIVLRRYGHVLDRLSVMFLEDQMLELQS